MAATAVRTAGMPLAVTVMAAPRSGIKAQLSCQKRRNRIVRITGDTAIKPNTGVGQGHLGTAADAAADQGIHSQGRKKTGQSAVAAAIGIHYPGRNHLPICDLIELELRGVAKVLEYLTSGVSNCNDHIITSIFDVIIIAPFPPEVN